MVYIIVNRSGCSISNCDEADYEDQKLITAMKPELKEGDKCAIVKPGNIAATLHSTTELDALKFARVARNTFQRINFSGRDDSISIGVLLHQCQDDECLYKALGIVHELAEKASEKPGNAIECIDLVR